MVDNHIRLTYNEIHKLIGAASAKIQEEFAPDVLIAIGSVPIMIFVTVAHSLVIILPTRRRVSGIGDDETGV